LWVRDVSERGPAPASWVGLELRGGLVSPPRQGLSPLSGTRVPSLASSATEQPLCLLLACYLSPAKSSRPACPPARSDVSPRFCFRPARIAEASRTAEPWRRRRSRRRSRSARRRKPSTPRTRPSHRRAPARRQPPPARSGSSPLRAFPLFESRGDIP
jgi:hypothetical protein